MVILAEPAPWPQSRPVDLLAAKQRGSDEAPFPDKGLSGGEIRCWAISA